MEISSNECKEIISKQIQQVGDCNGTLTAPSLPGSANHDQRESRSIVKSLKDKKNTMDIDVRENKLREV